MNNAIVGGGMTGVTPRVMPGTPGDLQRANVYQEQYSVHAFFNFTVINEQQIQSIPVLQDANFEMFYITARYANIDFYLQLSDNSTGKTLMDAQLPAVCILGTASLPFICPVTYIFRRNGSIRITATNGVALANNPIWIVLIGSRNFDMQTMG